MTDVHESVSTYYGETVQKTDDLDYAACCVSDYDEGLTANLTDEVLERRYGCGSPLPDGLAGRTVLDLGCGAGADCFMAAQLAGPEGRVIGLDMTDEQLAVARRNIDPHMDNFGFDEPTTEFIEGRIEEIPLEEESVDVVISNCVINLSPDKQSVFAEIWRVLEPGGEFYISDIVADRRVPERLQRDEKLWSECLTGALYTEDLRRVEARAGFADTRVVDARKTGDTIEGIHFTSQVRRGFKLDLEDRCEDYGQVAVYRGTLPGHSRSWALDEGHYFPAGEPVRVCKNTADMLTESRFAAHFQVSEPLSHLGLFEECANVPEEFEQRPQTTEPTPPSSVSLDSESTSADNADSSSGGCC